MKKICMFLMLLVCTSSFGQINLVSNPSFEDTVGCPPYYNAMVLSTGWTSFKETPDYFNSCNGGIVGVPTNSVGFQYAHSGNAYAGVITYSNTTINYRELIGRQLNQALLIGEKYFISFFACAAYNPVSFTNLASNKVGIRFSTIPYSNNNPAPINNIAHYYSNSIIADTLNWSEISGSFIADSTYQYLIIGNFFDDFNTSVINLDTNINQYSYILIDDIKVSTDSSFVNTAIKTYSNNSIKVFPNPARDWIVLEGKGIKSVEILNALGSEIGFYPTTAFTLHNQIYFGNLSCGVYFIKINMIDDKIHFQKIIVQY